MKKLLFALVACHCFAFSVVAQSDSTRLRSAFGSTIHFSGTRWGSVNTELVHDNRRFGIEGGAVFTRFLGENWYVQAGLESNKRRTSLPVAGVEHHVVETFTQLPVLVGYGVTTHQGSRYNRRVNTALGGYAAQLERQGTAPVSSERIKLEKRQNHYVKFGFVAEVSCMLVPRNGSRIMHGFGIRSFLDINGAVIRNNSSTPVFSRYSGGSLFYTMYFPRFR